MTLNKIVSFVLLFSLNLFKFYEGWVLVVRNIGRKQIIFSVYTRALEACGLEFRSDKLWVEFVDWEIAFGDVGKALPLFDVLISTPTALYASHYEK